MQILKFETPIIVGYNKAGWSHDHDTTTATIATLIRVVLKVKVRGRDSLTDEKTAAFKGLDELKDQRNPREATADEFAKKPPKAFKIWPPNI